MWYLMDSNKEFLLDKKAPFCEAMISEYFDVLWKKLSKVDFISFLHPQDADYKLSFLEKVNIKQNTYLAIYEESAAVLAQRQFEQSLHNINNSFTTVLIWSKLLEKDKDQLSESNQSFLNYGNEAVDKMKSQLKTLQEQGLLIDNAAPISWEDTFFKDLGIELAVKHKMFCSKAEDALSVTALGSNNNSKAALSVGPINALETNLIEVSSLVYLEKPESIALIAALQQVAYYIKEKQNTFSKV